MLRNLNHREISPKPAINRVSLPQIQLKSAMERALPPIPPKQPNLFDQFFEEIKQKHQSRKMAESPESPE